MVLFFLYFNFFIFGIIIGSFLNVVIYRLKSEEGGIIMGSSHCRDCNHELSWKDNIPLFSYLSLGGKCRYCKNKISLQYPIVEFSTGLLFVLSATGFLNSNFIKESVIVAILTALVFAGMLAIFVYDLKYMEVPMIVVYISGALATASIFLNKSYNLHDFLLHLLSAVVAFLFFFSFSFFSDEKWMGYGDGYIAFVIGLILGPFWTFVALLVAVWGGSIVGVLAILLKGKNMNSALPFGPFLISGLFIAFFLMKFFPNLLDFMKI